MYLYQSNRLEPLFTALCEILAQPLQDPLAAEIIVVQNPGMARWLSHRLAEDVGIAAHIRFPLPASFIWEVYSLTLPELPDLSAFDKNVLIWRIVGALQSLAKEPAMAAIQQYLATDDTAKSFQLAIRITDLFDQYQVYRPDMLLSWEEGADDHWQALLWRYLTAMNKRHRAELLQRFQATAATGNLDTSALPERVSLFGINAMAPAHLSVIHALSAFTTVRFFHLSPCKEAWGDIISHRNMALKRQQWQSQGLEDVSEYYTSGNPLLASMGNVGRIFFDQLVEYDLQTDPACDDLYVAPEGNTLLSFIQEDILILRNRQQEPPQAWEPDDTSIRLHCCHSPMREIQVLHDRLLDIFVADPSLQPADILVMAPDIDRYYPAVTAVFGTARGNQFIPWSMADQARGNDQPVIEAFLGLLALAKSRCTASEVVALLENRAILHGQELTEDDVARLRQGVMASGIRWGLDSEHRQSFVDDTSGLHTWQFGLERMLLAHATGPLDSPFLDIIPVRGMAADFTPWLGELAAFVSHLSSLIRQLNGSHEPAAWSAILYKMLETFFEPCAPSDQESLLMLRSLIHDFTDHCQLAGFTGPLDLSVITLYFEELLAESAGGHSFLAGKVTFCNMVPMRSIPFAVIWLLGMNDGDYPRSQRPIAFDLMAAKPRPGDRCRRDDDRYLFLEALLSARKQLAISWIGRDLHENTPRPPSVLVSELRDYIDRSWYDRQGQPVSECLTTVYPLQPFSRRCFDPSAQTASYAAVWQPAQSGAAERFISASLPVQESRELDINGLVRFWAHPGRFFLENRLGVRLRQTDALLTDTEPFALDHLQKYLIHKAVSRSLETGEDITCLQEQLLADAELPREEIGHLDFEEIVDAATMLMEKLKPLTAVPVAPCDISLQVSDLSLSGQLASLYQSGRIGYRPAKLKGKDLLQVWIYHLLLCLQRPSGVELCSVHAAIDQTITFSAVDDPARLLEPFVHFYQQGQCQPLHFYPETSYAWANGKQPAAQRNGAEREWYPGYKKRGESADPAYAILLRGQEPLDEQFQQLATTLFAPLIEHCTPYHATA